MINWDEVKGKMNEYADKAKKSFSVAADRTQRGAKVASLKVKIVMEENKINKAMGELGKRVYDLVEKGETEVIGNSQVKEAIKAVKSSKQAIDKVREEIKSL